MGLPEQLHRLGEARDLRRGLRPRPQPGLLPAAEQQGQRIFRPAPDIQRPDAFRTADLVGGEGDIVRP